ncbi:MAG TPA: hypothetical protein VK324_06665, partial [Tepidisphaeraceae bacterium]|nr:hypothetical protein [Tepidisphaeraceae bacterium]
LLAALRAAAKPVAFACGVDVVGPFEVLVDSPTLRATADQRRRAAVAQQESVERLKRIATAADALRAAGDLPAAALMAAVRAEDRGETLRGLLKAQADAAAPAVVWAVAGTSPVRVDPTTGAAAAVHVSFPPELGPLRSVTSAIYEHRDVLLVGGRGGVAVVSDAATAPRADFYRADVGDSPYGFNSAATVDGGHLYACHADAGLVVWPIGSKPPSTVVDVRNARNLVSLSDGGAYAFSVGHEVRVATRDGSARPVDAGGADVVALLPTLGRLTVVREDGALTVLDAATFAPTWIGRRTGRLCAATTLHWSGGDRLLLATEDGPVVACGLTDDDVVTHYASGHRGLRAIAASPQVVAAASADRQRLVLWNAWDGQAPVAEVNVARVIGNRVTDVAVL